MFGLDDIFSSVVDTGLSFLGNSFLAGQANDNSAKAAAAAYANNLKAFQRRYQDTVTDMRAAGLNPILAATGGFNVSGAPTMPMAQSFMGSMSGVHPISSTAKDYAEAEQATTGSKKNEVEIERTYQEIKNKQQDVKESIQRIAESRAREGKTTQEEMLIGRQIINVMEDTIVKIEQARSLRADVIKSLSQADLNDQEKFRSREDVKRISALVASINQGKKMMEAEYSRLKKMSSQYDIPVIGHILAGINNLLNFGGGAPASAAIGAIAK